MTTSTFGTLLQWISTHFYAGKMREVSAIDPWRSSLSDDSGAERGLPVGKYFQQKPLEWVRKPVTPDTYRLLCQLNYNSDGECSYFNN